MCIIPDEFKRTKPATNNTLKRRLKMKNIKVSIENDVFIPQCYESRKFAELIGRKDLGSRENGSWGNKYLILIRELGYTIQFVKVKYFNSQQEYKISIN